MIGSLLLGWAVCLPGAQTSPQPACAEIWVLDGPEVHFLREALVRVGIKFRAIDHFGQFRPAPSGVLVLCGKKPPLGPADAPQIKTFVEEGGRVLAVGGGAAWVIDQKLFDARPYYLAGTTIHMSGFVGYHRLTYGYPARNPPEGWIVGVPMLLRATEGPLMELGPQATSILSAGKPFSLAAFQRIGRGLVLAIGPDPQGGKAYYSLGKPTLKTGDKLGTDRLLANALAFLADPHCNLIPNAGFEEDIGLAPAQSHWQIELSGKATTDWCRQGAAEGQVFLRVVAAERSTATVRPFCPIVVERGAQYRLAFVYRASAPWTIELRFFGQQPDGLTQNSRESIRASAAGSWQRHELKVSVPPDACALAPVATLQGPGELCLDGFTLQRESP